MRLLILAVIALCGCSGNSPENQESTVEAAQKPHVAQSSDASNSMQAVAKIMADKHALDPSDLASHPLSNYRSLPAEIRQLAQRVEIENDHCRGGHGDDPDTMRSCNRRYYLTTYLEKKNWCYEEDASAKWMMCSHDPDYRPGQYGSSPPYSEQEIQSSTRNAGTEK